MFLHPLVLEVQDRLHQNQPRVYTDVAGEKLAHDIVLIQPPPLFRLPLVSPRWWITNVPIRKVERCRFAQNGQFLLCDLSSSAQSLKFLQL